jgi:serine/threonine-protein kinase RsbW
VPALSIALRNDRKELGRLSALIDRFGEDHRLSADSITNVNLVLDEIVANVIRHGRLDGADREIDISLLLDGSELAIEVADEGIAFDPVAAPAPNLDVPIEERRPGGLGIHIVKSLADTVAYRREGGRNYLTVRMRV